MSEIHKIAIYKLTVRAFLLASNPQCDKATRKTAIEFLYEQDPSVIHLNYEGNKFVMHTIMWKIISVIKEARGSTVALVEILRFYQQYVNYSWLSEAIESPLFYVKKVDNT